MKSIDLNCDMGELLPGQIQNLDEKIMPFISSCNVSCGFHSGDPFVIEQTIRSAIRHQVKIGAHPSYDDRKNFGRESMKVKPEVLRAQLRYQISAVKGMVESLGHTLQHVKPHGALYNDMASSAPLASIVIEIIKEIDPDLMVYGMAESIVKDICLAQDMKFVSEAFTDRRYESSTVLRNRKLEGAVIHKEEEILRQVELLIAGQVEIYHGELIPIQVDSLCLHSDTKNAINLSKKIHDFLLSKDISIGRR